MLGSGQLVHLHPSSVLVGKKPDYVVFDELVRTTRTYARGVAVIEGSWLPELAPAFFAKSRGSAGGVGGARESSGPGECGGGWGGGKKRSLGAEKRGRRRERRGEVRHVERSHIAPWSS